VTEKSFLVAISVIVIVIAAFWPSIVICDYTTKVALQTNTGNGTFSHNFGSEKKNN